MPCVQPFELAAAIENRRDGLVSHQLRQFPHQNLDVLFDRPAAFAGRVLLDLQWRVVTALLMQDHLNLVIFDAHEDFTQDGADNPLARRYCRGRMRPRRGDRSCSQQLEGDAWNVAPLGCRTRAAHRHENTGNRIDRHRDDATKDAPAAPRRARDPQDESTANVYFLQFSEHSTAMSETHPICASDARRMTSVARFARHPTAYFSTRWRVVQVFRWCSLRRI